MIYTVTCNPALDYRVRVAEFKPGAINRAKSEHLEAGGKGVNVSKVLKRLGVESVATGFVAGITGDIFCRMLAQDGISSDFVRVKGNTRINVKIRAEEETDLNGNGPTIDAQDWEHLEAALKQVPLHSVLVLAGSVPRGVSGQAYRDLLQRLGRKDLKVVIDACGELLAGAVEQGPWLVKPNLDELGELYGVSIQTKEEALTYAQKLCCAGAENVLVSMGACGAMLVSEAKGSICVPAYEGKAIDTVGAGDSLLAAYLAAKEWGKTDEEALRFGVAAGCATAFSEGLANASDVYALFSK